MISRIIPLIAKKHLYLELSKKEIGKSYTYEQLDFKLNTLNVTRATTFVDGRDGKLGDFFSEKVAFIVDEVNKITDSEFFTSIQTYMNNTSDVGKIQSTKSNQSSNNSIILLGNIKENINYISDNNIKIIIPAKILNEFTHIFNSEIPTDIQISCTHNKISFSYENIYVISRLIEGQFPDYNRVIPKEFKTHVNINKNEFQSALDRVSLISRSGDYNIIHFEFVDNIVRISSDNPNIGKAEETINVDIEGPGINISFNAKYIIDVLKAIDAENFIFSFNQPLTTASITQRDNKNFVYVVTPVRTKTM